MMGDGWFRSGTGVSLGDASERVAIKVAERPRAVTGDSSTEIHLPLKSNISNYLAYFMVAY